MRAIVQSQIKQRAFKSPAEAAFVGLLFVGNKILQRLEDACASHGLTHTQYNVLRILRGVYPEGHPRCEVAERLVTRAPDVTRLLDRLERQGLIERGWSKENRRLSIAKITFKGLALLKEVDPDVKAVEDETVGKLSVSDQNALARMCDRMAGE
ncbi:MAG: MarR family transcriptional regulator [Bryobacteraceae bacterium]|nr:MarR family transcriptional regulator [Bryobacteraceae bacterium]